MRNNLLFVVCISFQTAIDPNANLRNFREYDKHEVMEYCIRNNLEYNSKDRMGTSAYKEENNSSLVNGKV